MQYMDKGLPIALIGYVMVFVVLCLIWGAVVLMRNILSKDKSKSGEGIKNTDTTPTQAMENVAPVVVAEQADDEGELIAILTAAIAASLGTSTYNLRIKSFRRIETVNNVWANQSKNDAINKFKF